MFLSLDILIKEVVTERGCHFLCFVRAELWISACVLDLIKNLNIFGCLGFKYIILYGVIEIGNRY